MSIRKTIQIGDDALKAENEHITNVNDPKIKQVIIDLKDTMIHNNLIGMAAPQISENYQIFVTEPRLTPTRSADQTDIYRCYINPKIIQYSKEEILIYEGCGSVLNGQLFGPVLRPTKITIEAQDGKGKKFQLTCDGILARAIQHEYDHLQGIEFLEKVSDYRQMMTVEHYVAFIKQNPELKENGKITVIECKQLKNK